MLPAIPSKDPAVIMGILGVYKMTLEHERLGIPKEVIASQIIPFLFPLCVEPGLSLQQFRSLMATIKDMMMRVEDEQKSKLENVAAMQAQHRSQMNLTMDSLSNDMDKSTVTLKNASRNNGQLSNSSGQDMILNQHTSHDSSLGKYLFSLFFSLFFV